MVVHMLPAMVIVMIIGARPPYRVAGGQSGCLEALSQDNIG